MLCSCGLFTLEAGLSSHNASATPVPTIALITPSVATATPSPSGTPGDRVIFDDNFTAPNSGWSNDAHCAYASDGYHIPDGYACYAPVQALTDSVISADVEQVAGPTHWYYGILFRHSSGDENEYAFYIAADGAWKFSKFTNGQRSDLTADMYNQAIHTGLNVVNTLSVRAAGSHFTLIVNGQQVGNVEDATYSGGFCGVVGNSETGVQIVVKRFTVSKPQ